MSEAEDELTNVEIIQQVAQFAAPAGKTHGMHWEGVHFEDGVVYAQNEYGGMLAMLDGLDLNCSVSATLLQKVLKALPSNPKFKVSKTEMTVSSGSQATAKLPLMLSGEPSFHRPDPQLKWSVTDSLCDVQRAAWACSTDVTRPTFQALHLGAKGIESTNGSVAVRIDCGNFHEMLGRDVLVMARELKGIGVGPRYLAADDRRLYVSLNEAGTRYRSLKLIEGQFPDIEQLFPAHVPSITATKDELQAAIKRARVSAKAAILRVSGGALSFKTDLTSEQSLFEYSDSVEVREVEKGFNLDPIGIDLDYLQAAVQHACEGGEISLRMDDPLRALQVVAPGYLALVMPRRIA